MPDTSTCSRIETIRLRFPLPIIWCANTMGLVCPRMIIGLSVQTRDGKARVLLLCQKQAGVASYNG